MDFKNLYNRIEKTLEVIVSGVTSEFKSEDSLISEEVLELINNPSDKKELDNAVEYLQNHKDIREKEVELSDRKITISIG